MSGDVNNVAVWADADVLIGDLDAVNPVGGAAFGADWDFAGILDGSAGFSESQTNDSTDFFGWGKGVVATARKNLKITRTFTAIEDNLVTLGLRYDVTGVTAAGTGYSGDLKGRDLERKFKVAFEVRTGGKVKRLISKNYAQVESIGDSTEGEDNLATSPVTVAIYPDSDGAYWETYKGDADDDSSSSSSSSSSS